MDDPIPDPASESTPEPTPEPTPTPREPRAFFRKAQEVRHQGLDIDPNNPPLWVQQLVGGIVSGIVEARQPAPAWLEPILTTQTQMAETLKEQTRPKQDINPPQISPYNPRGDRDFPRPEFKCAMFQAGVKCERSTHSYDEIVLLNRLEPGEYWIRKTDGSEERVPVVPTFNPATGDLTSLNIKMDVKDQAGHKRHGWPSLANLCRQILGEPEVHPPTTRGLRTQARQPNPEGVSDLTDAVVAAQRPDVRDALTAMRARTSDPV